MDLFGEDAKPINTADTLCPMGRGPVKEACHKCELWMRLYVNGQPRWACALKWPALMAAVSAEKIDGMGKALEQTRNQLNDQRKEQAQILKAAVAVRALEGPPPSPPQIELKADAEHSDDSP